ncbi:protein of unknown function [Magnetospirillum gryphiswaldense MSR-1 v2]|uniref:Uncharacterized protein n=1 Tax=Magnetospirillum gryphiswaldense (strain DSM 6361 / JCM 21280 / NBRC 15271 / MSR-1) TaxID=431944 RepID=V6F6H5_MAGGM|nr:protein of unknown function [Magnetospirillum gryphiswaldense MSR-1 v2]
MLGHFVATRQATAVAPATVCQRERPLGMFIANYGHLAINCHRSPPLFCCGSSSMAASNTMAQISHIQPSTVCCR